MKYLNFIGTLYLIIMLTPLANEIPKVKDSIKEIVYDCPIKKDKVKKW